MSKTIQNIKNWLGPPSFLDEDKTRRARILYAILLIAFFSIIAFTISVPFISSSPLPALVVVFIIFVVALTSLIMMQQGRVWLAGFVFTISLWLVMAPVHFLFGGISNTGITIQFVIVVIAGLIIGKRATLFFTALAILMVTAVVVAEVSGLLPEPLAALTPFLLWLNLLVSLMAVSALLYVAISGLYDALEKAKQNEQALVKQNEELAAIQQSLQKNITKLEQTQNLMQEYAAELERSNRELQDFAYIVSHDLKAPLRKVQSFGDRLLAKYSDSLDESGRDYIQRMQNAAARMRTLIDDLLLFSRISTRAKPFTTVDLNAVVAAVILDLETRIEECHGRVTVSDLPIIEADSTQMSQLFQNLITNALKFQREGVPPEVTIGCRRTLDESIVLSIRDNGVGFEPHYAEQIFKVFERLHGQNEFEGTGIGLAICRRIVDRHHGVITAVSQPGQGTQFNITLPIHQKTELPSIANGI